MTHTSEVGTSPLHRVKPGTATPRILATASVLYGGTYPGQFGYVGQHRAHESYRRGRPEQSRCGAHADPNDTLLFAWAGFVTVDELLRRHRGWPLALLDNRRYMPTPAANMLPGMPLDAS